MAELQIGIVGIGVLFFFLFLGIPIAFSLGFLGIAIMVAIEGFSVLPLAIFGIYGAATDFPLVAIALFILMAEIILFSGMNKSAFDAATKLVGHAPGGLAIATMGSCTLFAAVTGSSVANTATIGMLTIPEMEKRGYDKGLAASCVGAGGALGILIPPSLLMILYGVLADESIGQLFIGGIIPGLMLAFLFVIIGIWLRAVINPRLAPRIPAVGWPERLKGLLQIWPLLLLMVIVLGTIFAGVCTPTESAGVGAAGALIISCFFRKLSWGVFYKSIIRTVNTTCMIMWILLGANVFANALSLSGVPRTICALVVDLQISPIMIIVAINLVLIALGMFLETASILMITAPILIPLMMQLDYNLVWFGVLFTINMELALITPPVGYNLFVLQGVAPNIPLATIYRGILPFVLCQAVVLSLAIIFPDIILWLPSLLIK